MLMVICGIGQIAAMISLQLIEYQNGANSACCPPLQEEVEIVYKGNCYHLDDILVDKFCPSDLIDPGSSPLLLQPQKNLLQLTEESVSVLQSPHGSEMREASVLPYLLDGKMQDMLCFPCM